MLVAQRVASGLSLLAVAKIMSSVVGSPSSQPPGMCLHGVLDAHTGSPPQLRRLTDVPGYKPDRINDLLLLRPLEGQTGCSSDAAAANDGNSHVVFFHGDIQNFEQEMLLEPEGAQWQAWSLERVALTLGRRFPQQHVWVVRASRMYLHKFCSYQNFVESNMFGAPEHTPDYGAFHHLRALLGHGMEQAGLPNPVSPEEGANTIPQDFSMVLVGFSKGCVVLNQMVYELAGARANPKLAPFVERISDMYWLDGGHPGGSETWVTDKRALRELASSGVAIHAHVTPYEVCDPMRAWVGREHQRFIKTLEELGACVNQKLHFENEIPSIENHFRVIQDF